MTDILNDGLRLIEMGLPIYPFDSQKKPVGDWRNGGQDYFVEPMTAQEWEERCRDLRVTSVAVLCSDRFGTISFDVEKPGADEPAILGALNGLPETCLRATPSGGLHAILRVTSGDHPGGSKALAFHAPGEDAEGAKPVLLAEYRGHAACVVVTGPGRPPLADDFEVAEVSREEFDEIADAIRAVGTYHPRARRRQRFVNRSAGVGGVQEVLHSALRDGSISPIALLPEGWTESGYDAAGKVYLTRPGGEGQSGNTLDGITTIHSTSVEWASAGEPMNAAQLLARSRFDDDYAAALRWVERLAADRPDGDDVWPAEVLRAVREATTLRQPQSTAPPSGFTKSAPLGEWFGRTAFAGKFRFAPGVGWLRWDGRRWESIDEDVPLKVLTHAVGQWVAHVNRTAATREERASAAGKLNEAPLKNLLAAARRVDEVRADGGRLDHLYGHLNVANGIIDLRTGELRPHDPDALFTKIADVEYERGFQDDLWTQALDAFADAETERWTQMFYGAAAAGCPGGGSVMPTMFGSGANGKSTIIGMVNRALGDFAVKAPDAALESGGHSVKYMPLRGARLAYMEELDAGHVLPIKALKDLVDTTEITARGMHKEWVTWAATHHLCINSNYLPVITEHDHGTWRRLAIVPFPKTYPVSDFRSRVMADDGAAKAALAWLVEGSIAWYAGDRKMPEPSAKMADAANEWQAETDSLGQWLESSYVPQKGAEAIPVKELRDQWNEWNPGPPWGDATFTQRLKAHRFVQRYEYIAVKREWMPDGKRPVCIVGVAPYPHGGHAQGASAASFEGEDWEVQEASAAAVVGGDRDDLREVF